MEDEKKGKKVTRQIIAIFLEGGNVVEAVEELEQSGINAQAMGVMARESSVQQKLGNIYTEVRNLDLHSAEPEPRFLRKEGANDTVLGLTGGLYFAGGTAAMGTVVASAALLGGPLAVAISGAAAVGVVGTLVGKLIHKNDADYLREQLDEGHVLLFVPVPEKSMEDVVKKIIDRHSPIGVKVYDVPEE